MSEKKRRNQNRAYPHLWDDEGNYRGAPLRPGSDVYPGEIYKEAVEDTATDDNAFDATAHAFAWAGDRVLNDYFGRKGLITGIAKDQGILPEDHAGWWQPSIPGFADGGWVQGMGGEIARDYLGTLGFAGLRIVPAALGLAGYGAIRDPEQSAADLGENELINRENSIRKKYNEQANRYDTAERAKQYGGFNTWADRRFKETRKLKYAREPTFDKKTNTYHTFGYNKQIDRLYRNSYLRFPGDAREEYAALPLDAQRRENVRNLVAAKYKGGDAERVQKARNQTNLGYRNAQMMIGGAMGAVGGVAGELLGRGIVRTAFKPEVNRSRWTIGADSRYSAPAKHDGPNFQGRTKSRIIGAPGWYDEKTSLKIVNAKEGDVVDFADSTLPFNNKNLQHRRNYSEVYGGGGYEAINPKLVVNWKRGQDPGMASPRGRRVMGSSESNVDEHFIHARPGAKFKVRKVIRTPGGFVKEIHLDEIGTAPILTFQNAAKVGSPMRTGGAQALMYEDFKDTDDPKKIREIRDKERRNKN